jgi:hypothetical protein
MYYWMVDLSVNIISESLKKLGLRKPKLAPFVVKMAN